MCMRMCMYMYVYVYVCMYVYICVSECVSMHVYVCKYVLEVSLNDFFDLILSYSYIRPYFHSHPITITARKTYSFPKG